LSVLGSDHNDWILNTDEKWDTIELNDIKKDYTSDANWDSFHGRVKPSSEVGKCTHKSEFSKHILEH
jgi:hypothetical protein